MGPNHCLHCQEQSGFADTCVGGAGFLEGEPSYRWTVRRSEKYSRVPRDTFSSFLPKSPLILSLVAV